MISKTREKIPDSQIISFDDNLKFKGNVSLKMKHLTKIIKLKYFLKINFPAITIIPEVVIKRDYHDKFMLFRGTKDSEKEELKMMLKNETFKNDAIK